MISQMKFVYLKGLLCGMRERERETFSCSVARPPPSVVSIVVKSDFLRFIYYGQSLNSSLMMGLIENFIDHSLINFQKEKEK